MSTTAQVGNWFDTFNVQRLRSPTLEAIWQSAYGEDYARASRPNAFYPQSVLNTIVQALQPQICPESLLVDLGCGHGRPGLYLASQLRCPLLGLDISPASIRVASQAAGEVAITSNFAVADISYTTLENSSCSAAVSLDVLLYLPDKQMTLHECARILRKDGHLCFTVWEQEGHSERLGTDQIADYRPLLEEAGFEVESYEEVSDWKAQQRRVLEQAIIQKEVIRREIGDAAEMFAKMASGALVEMDSRRYVLAIAKKKGVAEMSSEYH